MGGTLEPEDRIAHYRVVGPLGVGGMGEVYWARDLTLERDVALKVLPPDLMRSEERVRRFTLEARSASSLNHPHIVTIHEIGAGAPQGRDADAPRGLPLHYIAMELVHGRTLAAAIHDEKAPLETLLGWLAQAAEGLSKAHAAGIVHRDLKPGNIMIAHDGYAKVLDFGLAKLVERRGPTGDATLAPTAMGEDTSAGQVLGTAGYMAPEQVQGKPVDHRADIFAFGCMLYEAATGRRPFDADSSVETMHRILHDTPAPVESLNARAPAELRRLIRRCLAKDPNQRLDSMKSLALELREIVEEFATLSASATSASVPRTPIAAGRAPRRARAWIAIPIAVTIALGLTAWFAFGHPWRTASNAPAPPPEWKQLTASGRATAPDLSPDGHTVSYIVQESGGLLHLMVQDVTGGSALQIFESPPILNHRWTAAGNDIQVFAASESAAVTWLIPRMGGQRRVLATNSWSRLSPDGTQLAQWNPASHTIRIVPASGGDGSSIDLEPHATWLFDVEWSPDGALLLACGADETHRSLWTVRRDGRGQQKVFEIDGDLETRWAPRGDAVYCLCHVERKSELRKVYLNRNGGAARTPPRVLVSDPSLVVMPFGISNDGRRLACTRTVVSSNLWSWETQPGTPAAPTLPRQLTEGAAFLSLPELSPDGQRVAFLSNRGGTANVHVLELADRSTTQLTFLDHDVGRVVWSPDGASIAYTAVDGDTLRVWRMPSRGGAAKPFKRTRVGDPEQLAWSPGKRLLVGQPGNRNFLVLDPETEASRPLVANESLGWMFNPVWSPDQNHVIVFWNRPPRLGSWVLSAVDGGQHLLMPGRLFDESAMAWTSDSASILAVPSAAPWRVLRMHYPGGDTITVARIPVAPDRSSATLMALAPDLRRLVYVDCDVKAEVWLLENFDPEVR